LLHAGLDPELVEGLPPRWNIGPMSEILGVAEDGHGGRRMSLYRWGLVPGGASDPATIRGTFNARAETVATKPTFRAAFRKRRILVPVDAFYEWAPASPMPATRPMPATQPVQATLPLVETQPVQPTRPRSSTPPKQPYAFKRADGGPVVFAGLREYWKGADGTELRTATIITTEAGPDMPIHDRQPVVLEPDTWDHWLDPEVTDRDELEPLLTPSREGTLVHYPVSRDVGNVRNDGPELVREVAAP
jgi:putative SOS response-associated peptidase YedK